MQADLADKSFIFIIKVKYCSFQMYAKMCISLYMHVF